MVIARQNGSPASAADRDVVLAKGKAAAEEVATAQQLIGSQIASGNTLGDDLGLMRLNTRLEFLQRDLERLQVQDATLLADMMTTGDVLAANDHLHLPLAALIKEALRGGRVTRPV